MLKRLSSVALLSLSILGGAASAQSSTPTTGLGQSWPNAPDVSRSPNYHVYVFVLDGIRYVQVNDLTGHVLAAVASSGGTYLRLPIGIASVAETKSTEAALSQARHSAARTNGDLVYQDDSLQLAAASQTNGVPTVTVAACDPIDCNTRVDTPQQPQ